MKKLENLILLLWYVGTCVVARSLSEWQLLPPAAKLGQGYVFTGVCDSVHRGRSTWPGTPPPDQVHPPGLGAPPGPGAPPLGLGTPPGTRYTPLDQVHPPRTRYTPQTRYTPPGPGTPPSAEHAGRYGQCAGGTHPTGMQSRCENVNLKRRHKDWEENVCVKNWSCKQNVLDDADDIFHCRGLCGYLSFLSYFCYLCVKHCLPLRWAHYISKSNGKISGHVPHTLLGVDGSFENCQRPFWHRQRLTNSFRNALSSGPHF